MKPFRCAPSAHALSAWAAVLSMVLPFGAEAIEINMPSPLSLGGVVVTDINHTINAGDDPYAIVVPGGTITIRVGISTFDDVSEYANASGGGTVVFSLAPFADSPDAVTPNFAVAGFFTKFGPGDIVDGMDFSEYSTFGNFYDPFDGEWAAAGDTGFLGWRSGTLGDYTYGWLETTRGSLTVGQLGYNSTANAGAPIPAPAPATLALLALGLVGIGYKPRVS